MMNAQVRIVAPNQAALDLTGKEQGEVSHELGGDVLVCKHPTRGRLWKPLIAVACTIRNTVIRTFETGESLHKVPAYLLIDHHGQDKYLEFLISTEKQAEAVLLRIDKVEPQATLISTDRNQEDPGHVQGDSKAQPSFLPQMPNLCPVLWRNRPVAFTKLELSLQKASGANRKIEPASLGNLPAKNQ